MALVTGQGLPDPDGRPCQPDESQRCGPGTAARAHDTRMDPARLRDLPAVVDLTTAAALLGVGRSSAYELVRCGCWPTPVLRLGRRIRIPSAALLQLLCVPVEPDACVHNSGARVGLCTVCDVPLASGPCSDSHDCGGEL